MKIFGKVTAIAGFSLIVGPALLAVDGFLDNVTFTGLFIAGFVLVLASSSNRTRSTQTR